MQYNDARIACPNCGATDPLIQSIQKSMNVFAALGYIILLFVPVIGWIALFWMLTSRKKTFTNATCQKCAHQWEIPRKRK